MKAYLVSEFGGPEVLKLTEMPDPVAGPNQALVRVHASGVNFAETKMRAGDFRWMPPPFTIGQEAAGVIESIGEGLTGYKVGDRVFGRVRGSHSELAVFDAVNLMHLPDELSFVEGAAIPVGFLTAWHGLITVANLQEGQRVLLEAIASSVSSAALQIAKWKHCWVAGTTSSDEKIAAAKEHGADAVYNYQSGNVADEVMRDTEKKGIEVALVTTGGVSAQSTIAAMGMDGKVILCGGAGSMDYGFDLTIVNRNLQFLGMSIVTSPRFASESMQTFRELALPLFANKTFSAVVNSVLPHDQLAKAHQMIDERKHYGKIILQWI